MSYVPNSKDLESALTLLSLREDHRLPSPPLSLSPAPPPSPPLHVQIHQGRWRPLSPVRLDGGQVSEVAVQQEDQGHQAEVYTSGSEEGVVVPYL